MGVNGVVSFWQLIGLSTCTDCGSPMCRDCEGHTEYVRDLDGFGPGYRCECGWAVTMPMGEPSRQANWSD